MIACSARFEIPESTRILAMQSAAFLLTVRPLPPRTLLSAPFCNALDSESSDGRDPLLQAEVTRRTLRAIAAPNRRITGAKYRELRPGAGRRAADRPPGSRAAR